MIVTARYIAPVDGEVIEHGAVCVEESRITALGRAGDIATGKRVRLEFGNAVVTPGFVNAHTHLELTHLAGRVLPTRNFPSWLARLVAATGNDPPTKECVQRAVADGVAQSLNAGVTTVGDITRNPFATRGAIAETPIRAVSFGEVIAIGTRRHLLTERIEAALNRDHESHRLQIALSPHAPYTVEPDGLRRCARLAENQCVPLCIHAAETSDEAEFTRDASGAFAEHLRTLGVWDRAIPASGLAPIPLLQTCGLLTPRTVLAHANYLSDADIDRVARSRASVAFCPRTHAAFKHTAHRYPKMLDAGVNVCVATDSLASNPSLSILDELRFLHKNDPQISCDQLLTMGTLAPAKALGLQKHVGSITPGKDADLVVIPLPAGAPWKEMFRNDLDPIAVFARGTLLVDKR